MQATSKNSSKSTSISKNDTPADASDVQKPASGAAGDALTEQLQDMIVDSPPAQMQEDTHMSQVWDS